MHRQFQAGEHLTTVPQQFKRSDFFFFNDHADDPELTWREFM